MKPIARHSQLSITASLCCLAFLLSLPASAANVTKSGSGTDLTDGASWNGSVAPASSDVAVWDTGSLGTGLTLNSGTPGWLGFTVNAGATDPINIGSGGTLTLGTSGINLSASTINATIACNLSLASGYQAWSVATGKTLAINGTLSRAAGASMSFPTAGVTSTTLANDGTGILGGWATVTGTLDWATNSSVTGVGTYTGYTSLTGAQAPNSAQNWKNTGLVTLSGSGTINSMNVVGGDLAVGANTLTLGSGGLILGGTERWVSGTTGTLKSGLATGELYIHANTAAFANGFQIQPIIIDGSVATAVIKDGSGQCELGNTNNTFSGGFYLNAGAVYMGGNSTGSGGSVTRGPLGVGTVTLNGGTLFPYGKTNGTATASSGFTLANNINIPAGASAAINNGGGAGILSGFVNGSGVLNFQGAGSTTLIADNSSSYSGLITISAGTLISGGTTVAALNGNLGTGSVTNSGILRLGANGLANTLVTAIPNNITLAGGTIYAYDAFQHYSGAINITTGGTLGSTFNGGGGEADKGFSIDGLVSGSGALTIQHTRYDTTHTYDTSFVAFTNNANSYSGTITINENTLTTEAGVYLGVNGSTALQYATINVPGPVIGNTLRFGTSPVVFSSGLGGSATLGALTGSGPVVLSGYNEAGHTYNGGGNIALTVGANNSSTTYAGILSGGGSLIKAGSGTFTLTGTNTFTGGITISAGGLTIGGAGKLGSGIYAGAIVNNSSLNYSSSAAQTLSGPMSGSGSLTNNGPGVLTLGGSQSSSPNNITVSDAAILNEAFFPAVQLTANSLTVGTNTGATLGFIANSTSQARYVVGTLTLKGTATINILGGNLVVGNSYPLITYTTLAGGGSYALGAVPNGVTGNLSTSGNTIYFNVTGVTNTIWTGLVNSTWDINTTANWTNTGTLGNKYIDGGLIQFDDTGINTTTISNSALTILTPGNVLVTNNTLNYCFKTNIVITGNSGLTKTGTANLTNATPNTYTGPTVINKGGLVAGVASVANVSGALGLNSAVTVDNDATATLNLNGFATQIGSLTGGGSAGGNVVLGSGTLTVGGDNSSPAAYGGVISGTGGLTKIGTGTLTLNNTNTYTGATTVSSGKMALTGNATVPSITAGFVVGNANGANAAVYQSGNTAVTAQPTGGGWQLGSAAGAAGYYNLSSGTMMVTNGGEFDPGGSAGGVGTFGQFDMSGGSLIVGLTNNTGSSYFLPNRGGVGEASVVNLSGGTVNINSNMNESATFAGFEINWAAGGQTNTTTISGNAVFTSPSVSVKLNQNNNAANVCSLNLNGGLFQTLGFTPAHCASAVVNFNGGTLQAGKTANANFMGNVASVYSYGNGGTIDNNGLAITIAQALSSPTGDGVASIAVGTPGSGYIVPPRVIIVGDGTGATAYATINPTSGAVTGIVVTCPGTGYSTTPTVILAGGGGFGAAPGTVTMAPNTSGPLAFTGSGTTTLTGAYSITNGIKVLGGTLAMSTGNGVPSPAGNLIVSNATLTIDASSSTPMPANNVSIGSTLSLTLNPNANGINAAGNVTLGTNSTLNLNYGAVNPNPTAAAINLAGSLTKGTNIVINITAGGLSVGQFPLITAGSTVTTNNFKLGTLPPGIVAVLTNSTPNSLDLLITGAGQLLSWHGANADNSIVMTNWNINVDTNWYDLSFNLTKYLQYSGNSYGDNVTFGDNGYNTTGTNSVNLSVTVVPATVTFSSGTPYRLTGTGAIGGATSVLLTNASGTFYLETVNTYTGGTIVGGGTLAITNDNALGAVAGPVTLASGALQLNNNVTSSRALAVNANSSLGVIAGATAAWSGVVSGSSALTKIDNGTLNLSGSNTFSGATLAKLGILQVSGGTFGSTNSDIQISPVAGDAGTVTVSGGNVFDNRMIISGISANTGTFGPAVLNQSGGTITSRQWFTVGSGAGAGSGGDGTFNMSGGTLIVQNQQMEVGNFDLTTGTVNMNGGAAINIWNNNLIALGANNNAASGTINQTNGTVTFYSDAGTTVGGTGVLSIGKAGTLTGTFTYNLVGGLLNVPQVQGNAANAATRIFNFNGGTLRAAKANATFMFGLTSANVLTGGAIIDSSSNNITISQALLDGGTGGGLIKQGTGTLTLSGTNNYTGTTVVTNGELLLTPNYQAGGAVVVADNAKFGIAASAVTNSATIGALTLGSSGGSILDFIYTFAGNPTNVSLTAGAVTLNGTNTIHIGGSFVLGTFPVMKYASLSGVFNSTVSAPRGMGASVSNDTVNKVIYVTVTSLASPIVWTGTNSIAGRTNLWDSNNTTNWLIAGSPTTYQETTPPGDAVVFNDLGTGLVLLSNSVSPASMVISNNTVNYTFQGSGQISSVAGLTKLGAGSVTLNLPGTYALSTVVSNGTLNLGTNQSFANLSGNSTVATASGTPTLTVNNTTNTTFSGSLQGALILTKTGNGTLTLTGTNTFTGNLFGKAGTILLDSGAINGGNAYSSIGQVGTDNATMTLKGTGMFTNSNDFNVADVDNTVGTLNISNNASLISASLYVASANNAGSTANGTVNQTGGTVQNAFTVIGGRGPSTNAVGVYNLSGGVLTNTGAGSIRIGGVGTGTMNISGTGSAFIGTGISYVGYRIGSGTLNMTGGSFTAGGEFRVGGSDVNGATNIATGTVTLTNATMSVGSLTVARGNSADSACLGTVTLNGGSTLNSEGDVTLGFAGNGTLGKLVVNGGTLNVATTTKRWLLMGRFDTMQAELDVNSGRVNLNASTDIRFSTINNTGNNVFNLNGGAVTFYSDNATNVGGTGVVDLSQGTGAANNTFNLNGGTLSVFGILSATAAGTRTFNFNGGTLAAVDNNASFINLGTGSAKVLVGGAKINTTNFNVTIPQALLDGDSLGGGLTKTGNGTLTLNGVNTYTGLTAVNAGLLGGTGTIAGAVTVAGGAGLAPGSGGIGTLTVNGNITLNSTSTNVFEVNGTTPASDRIAAGASVTYGGRLKIVPTGTLTIGQQFLLFTGAGATNTSNFAGVEGAPNGYAFSFTNGVLSVLSGVNTTPTNLVAVANGSTLELTWPADHTGWRLQAQTNSLATGLGTNWVDVPNSTAVHSVTNIVNPASGTVFYRMVYP